jgi:predicted enzyme related to lactoylglutathione lyase
VEFYGALFGPEAADALVGGSRGAARWNMYVLVESAVETAAKVREAGGEVILEPEYAPSAGRMATFTDPEGAAFGVWQGGDHRGAGVDEHGTVNLNDLHTRDVETARAFYGAVFGWEELAMDGGLRMWVLPGYGDFLEEILPGNRERNERLGAPERYTDVVASIAPIPAGGPETPAHWGVTFTVDNADAVAATARDLGATVVMPPTNTPAEESGGKLVQPATAMSWARKTVITDPQGATFTASEFIPPEGVERAPPAPSQG